MYKGDLKLINLSTLKVLDFIQEQQNISVDTWKTFVVHSELQVSINIDNTIIKVNNDYYNVTKSIVHGKSNKYYCDAGEMIIKGVVGTWNTIGMGLKI
jgi:hypothetical protein